MIGLNSNGTGLEFLEMPSRSPLWFSVSSTKVSPHIVVDHLFRFSRFDCLFSLADFWGCFFLSFFASWDLDISAHLLVM